MIPAAPRPSTPSQHTQLLPPCQQDVHVLPSPFPVGQNSPPARCHAAPPAIRPPASDVLLIQRGQCGRRVELEPSRAPRTAGLRLVHKPPVDHQCSVDKAGQWIISLSWTRQGGVDHPSLTRNQRDDTNAEEAGQGRAGHHLSPDLGHCRGALLDQLGRLRAEQVPGRREVKPADLRGRRGEERFAFAVCIGPRVGQAEDAA